MGKCIITIEDGKDFRVSLAAEFDPPLDTTKQDQSFISAQDIGMDCVGYIQETFGGKLRGDQAPASVPQ